MPRKFPKRGFFLLCEIVKRNIFLSFLECSENKLIKKLQNVKFWTVFVRNFEKGLKKI